MKDKHKNILFVVFTWPILASLLSFFINANYFVSILLFFGVPSLYLSYLRPKLISKVLLYSAIFALPISIILDYSAIMSNVWFMPLSVLDPFRIFGLIVVENVLWVFLWVYFIIIFYEIFLEKHKVIKKYYPRLKYLFLILLTFVLFIIIIHFINPSLLNINFAYLKFGIVTTVLPITYAVFKFPKFYKKLLKIGIYFFTVSFLHEIVGLTLNQWIFPVKSTFLGRIYLLNGVNFPLEELIFFMILGAMAVVSFYEIFDDDGR